jgi:hypothetical protein
MDLLSVEDFLAWAGERGIGFDPQYPAAADLTFIGNPTCWRSWPLAFGPRKLPLFLATILEAASAPAWLVYPRNDGRWFSPSRPTFSDELLEMTVRCSGVPAGFVGAVRLPGTVPAEVVELLAGSLIHGGHIGHDLYAVSEDAGCILMADHHDQLIAKFPSKENLSQMSAIVAKEGYPD